MYKYLNIEIKNYTRILFIFVFVLFAHIFGYLFGKYVASEYIWVFVWFIMWHPYINGYPFVSILLYLLITGPYLTF